MIKIKPFQWFILLLTLSFVIPAAADRNRDFRKGRPRGWGNERSERVRQVATGQPSYGGNGCPQGSMNVLFSADYLSFTILFDQFVAELTADTKQRRDVMSCDAIIPLEIPEGMQMEITRVDFRGFLGLPQGTRANLHSVFNFVQRDRNRRFGGDGDRMNLRYQFEGPVMDNYEISSDVLSDGRSANTGVSPCGGPVRLRILNQMKLVSAARGQSATATIDSIDGSSNAIYYVNWKACTPSPGPGPGRSRP